MPSVIDDAAGELTRRTNNNNNNNNNNDESSGKNVTRRRGSMSAWDSAADPTIPYGSLQSALLFLIPCSLWVGSIIVTLIAMVVLPLFGYYIPLYFFLLYYAKRLIFGHVKRWPELQLWLAKQRNSAPYFKRQALILDDGVEPQHFRPGNKALMCAHPHGIFVLGWGVNILWNKFSIDNAITFFGASNVFWIPGFSEYVKWLGTESADKANMGRHMKKGNTIALCTGGFEEATLLVRGKHRLFLKQRKGFIKMALRYGYKIYPVYSFGEEETYHAFTGLLKFRLWLNTWKAPGICFLGRYGSILPLNHAELITVIGSPLECPLIPKPTNADVDHWHSLYMANVQNLFDKYKGQYAYHKEKAVLELC